MSCDGGVLRMEEKAPPTQLSTTSRPEASMLSSAAPRLYLALLAAAFGALGGCSSDATAPQPVEMSPPAVQAATLAQEVRQLATGRGIGPLERPGAVRPALVELGRVLAFDK